MSGRPAASSATGRPKRDLTFPSSRTTICISSRGQAVATIPQENFFGLGPDSARDARTDYAIRTQRVRRPRRRTAGQTRCCSAAGWSSCSPRRPGARISTLPSSETLRPFNGAGPRRVGRLPAIEAFARSRLSRAAKRAQGRLVPRRVLALRRSHDRPVHLQPRRRRSAAVRRVPGRPPGARRAVVRLDLRHRARATSMPFYLMPTLGGNDTLRGFREYRFRGPHAILAAGRVPVGDLERPRRRPVLRRRQGGATAAPISNFSEPRTRLWHSGSVSIPTTGSSFASTRRLGAVMASTCTSSLAACFRAVIDAGRARLTVRRVVCAGLRCADGGVTVTHQPRPAFLSRRSAVDGRRPAYRRLEAPPIEDTNGYDFVANTFAHPGERRDVRALNVNTLDEVPDSSWFTNRIGRHALSSQTSRSGRACRASALDGWMVSGGKALGVQPGFRMTDRTDSSTRWKSIRRRIRSWPAVPRSSARRSITPSAITWWTSIWPSSIARRS